MGIAVAGLIAGLSQSVKNASRLTDYDRAAMLARTKMNDLLLDANLPFDGTLAGRFAARSIGRRPQRLAGVVHAFRTAAATPGPGTMILQRVALEVWWQPPSGSRRTIDIWKATEAHGFRCLPGLSHGKRFPIRSSP